MAYTPNKNSTVHSNLLALVNHTNNSNLTEDQVEFVDPKYGLLTSDYLNKSSGTIEFSVGAPLIENGLPKKAIYFSKMYTLVSSYIGSLKTLVSSPMLPVAGLPVITDMDNVSLDDAKPIFGDYTFKLNPNDPLSGGTSGVQYRHLGLHEKPGFMSMISWTGNETPTVTIGHTLGDEPKSILIFKLTGTNSIENRTNGSILLHDPTEFALDSSETITTVIKDENSYFNVEHKNRITKNVDLILKIKSAGIGTGYNSFSFVVFNGAEEIFSGADLGSNEIYDGQNNEFLYTIPKSVFANIAIPENQSTLNLTIVISANEFVIGIGSFTGTFTITLARDFEFGETTITLPNEILSKVDGVNTIQYLNENNAKYLALLFGHDTSETGLIECVKFDYEKGNLVDIDSTVARARHTFAGVKRKYAGLLLFNANRDAFSQNGMSFAINTGGINQNLDSLFNKNTLTYSLGTYRTVVFPIMRVNKENNTSLFGINNIERSPHYAIIFYESTEKNSKLRIKAVNNKGFLNRVNKDGIVLEYNRIGVNHAYGTPVASFITDPTTTFAQLYQLAKDSNSLFEGEFVIEEFMQYAPNGDYNDKFVNDYPFTKLTVRPKGWTPTSAPVKYSESFIYTDSVLVISLRKDQYLDVAVATKELTGFVPVI